MRVAVTGASGFVGGHLVTALAARGHEVLSYGRRPAADLRTPLPAYRSWDLATAPLADPGVDAVVHCAACVDDWGSLATFRAVNVQGTHAMLTTFASARRIVLISTASVYSDDRPLVDVSEDAPTGGRGLAGYARTKAEAERVLLAARPDAVILRPHIIYGPGDTTLLPRVLRSRRFGRLIVPGDGRNLLSTTHIEHLALATVLALELPNARGAYNVADAEPARAGELLGTILERVGAPTQLLFLPRLAAWQIAATLESVWPRRSNGRGPPFTRFAVRSLADPHTLDITRARCELGYAPRWTFRDGPL